jgi:hypothetical protein
MSGAPSALTEEALRMTAPTESTERGAGAKTTRTPTTPSDQPKSDSRLWVFLNSSFGLWLLSAVFVTGAGAAYTSCKTSYDESTKNAETIDRLDFEIGYRFSQVAVRLCQVVEDSASTKDLAPLKNPDTNPGNHPCNPVNDASCRARLEANVRRVVSVLRRPPTVQADSKEPKEEIDFDERYLTLYPEYAQYGIPALVAELKRHLSEKSELDALDQVLAHLTGPYVFLQVNGAYLYEPQTVAGVIVEHLVLPRWKAKTKWYFLDGSQKAACP